MKRPLKPHSITKQHIPRHGNNVRQVELFKQDGIPLKADERIRFTRADGMFFDVMLHATGTLEVHSSRPLMIKPNVSNDVSIDCAPGHEPPRGEWLVQKKGGKR